MAERLLRLHQIIGNKKKGIEPIIPLCRTTFLNMVDAGIAPQKVRVGVRSVAWRESEIQAFIQALAA